MLPCVPQEEARLVARTLHKNTQQTNANPSFELVACGALLLAVACAVLLYVLGDTSGANTFASLPSSVSVNRNTFDSFEQKVENIRLGEDYTPLQLDFSQAPSVMVGYAHRYGPCYINEIQANASYSVLKAAASEDGTWTIQVRMPRQRDYLHPRGLWTLYLREENGTWQESDWVVFNEDGTGYLGLGRFNATASTEESVLKHSYSACRWHATEVDGAYLIVLDYESGQSTITVTV